MTKYLCTFLALAFLGSNLSAEEVKGKITKIEEDKITLSVNGKETTFTVDKSVKVQSINKKKKSKDVAAGLSSLKANDEVTLTTEKNDEKEVVTKITTEAKKKKKDK